MQGAGRSLPGPCAVGKNFVKRTHLHVEKIINWCLNYKHRTNNCMDSNSIKMFILIKIGLGLVNVWFATDDRRHQSIHQSSFLYICLLDIFVVTVVSDLGNYAEISTFFREFLVISKHFDIYYFLQLDHFVFSVISVISM